MNEILKKCNLCPRNCGVNRYESLGFCKASDKVKVAYYSLHQWEEPVISGINGSGTVFFSNCNLKCIFCQNKKISTLGYGKEISNERLKEIFLELQAKGAHNINLVTPTHYVPQIVEVLKEAKTAGLNIPIVYNTSSYENVSTIMLLEGIVDVYLADLKYFDDSLGCKYSKCENYFEVAKAAIEAMYEQVGKFEIVDDLMVKGVIVRVLVLPGHADDSKNLIKYLHETYGNNIIISIMNQYTPVEVIDKYPNLNRKVSDEEYEEVIDFAVELGVEIAFIQEGETQDTSFIPDFDDSVI
ncbi:MAG: radical SAM protein [Tenericutes bacterium]|nr:radical SAM protein [Mycoplasmatota bacterium]